MWPEGVAEGAASCLAGAVGSRMWQGAVAGVSVAMPDRGIG